MAGSWFLSGGPPGEQSLLPWESLGSGEIRFTEFYVLKPNSWAKQGLSGLELFILHKRRPSQAQCEVQAS